ncbi:MAG: putative sulfate exporter family transporter [Microbacteriaceae bacterium]
MTDISSHQRRNGSGVAVAQSTLPGLTVAVVIAAVATVVGTAVPLIGAPVTGIVAGVCLSPLAQRRPVLTPGTDVAKGFVLQLAVVVLGTQLSLRQVVHVGADSLPVMLSTVTVCLLLAWWVGRLLGIGSDLRTLVGVGTAICGASAIAAVSPTIRAKSADVAYAVSTIFLFNIAAVLAFPPLGHALGLSQHEFGLFAGTAVNDTSSVVAAAATYGTEASNFAVVVKLTRTLLIIPICLGLAWLVRRREVADDMAPETQSSWWRRAVGLVPWFLIGFLLAATANSIGLVPLGSHRLLQHVSVFLITVALTGIGLSTNISRLRRAGARPLLLGLILWLAVGGTSLTVQLLMHRTTS